MECGGPPACTTWGCGRWYFWTTWPNVTHDCCLISVVLSKISLASSSTYVPYPESSRELRDCLHQVWIQLLCFINRHLREASKNKLTAWPQQPYCVEHLPKMPHVSIIAQAGQLALFLKTHSLFQDIKNIHTSCVWGQNLISFVNMVGSFSENRIATVKKGLTVSK